MSLKLKNKLHSYFSTKFLKDLESNFTLIEKFANKLDNYNLFHKSNQENAHDSKQITHKLEDNAKSNVSDELKYQRSQIMELVLGNIGDGIQEVTASRVTMFGKRAGDLSNRLYLDFLNIKNDYLSRIKQLKDSLDYYINIKSVGAIGDGKTDNKDLFYTFSKKQIYYVPNGNFKTSILPDGMFFGKGRIFFNDEEIYISPTVPQAIKANVNKKTEARYPNFIVGQNSGKKLNEYSYAIHGYGYEVLKNNIQGRRLNAFGKGAMRNLLNGYSNDAFGSDALGQGEYGERNTALGSNALKWGGASDPIKTYHDFWKDKGDKNFINSYFKKKWGNVWDVLGSESKPKNSILSHSDNDYKENVGIGRNALLHLMKGSNNVAVGYNSQAHTVKGMGNTSIGDRSLRDNLIGNRNSAIGMYGLTNNITGQDNVSIGANSLQQTLHASNNTSIGYGAMHFFKDDKNKKEGDGHARRNTAVGTQAMQNGKNANFSTFIGSYSGRYVQGDFNVGIGASSLYNLVKGERNVGIGGNTNKAVVDGNENVAIGYTAGPNRDYKNTVSIGAYSHANGNNQIQIGSDSQEVYTFSPIKQRSDRRNKENIKDTELGLEFIKQLRPVDYNYKNSDNLQHGLIAQEIEELNTKFGGVHNAKEDGGDDIYSVSYTELIAPLIKSIQELSEQVKKLSNGGSVNG
ncbi:tail fiber domain-containing protein [Staphylococcus epidermidis]|jgi:hypothetical protein|uniref:tail fiber domain-containing protein n=1 Tax=Staphylococcus epidermidis TaxID=1282 RepID=UPI000E031CEA|nr:tail fiber domain-containing protein [Staphylococcus epidermidis]SUM11839.1 phage protein [Staphylococcus epidermidis]DAI80414.1 MAG TPA: Endo N acetylneuraminidase [Caudoviricetes sp.]